MEQVEEIDLRVKWAVARLANLLRRSGSRVLTNSSKLSLSLPVYRQISTALSLFASHTSDQAKVFDCKLILDLEYLKSFLSRVPSLILYHSKNLQYTGLISLGLLQHLRHLELKRIPVHLITDLSLLQPNLLSLSLSVCKVDVEELLSTCLGSLSTPGIPWPWTSLSHLSITHCGLSSLSIPGLDTTPHLTHLDLSHNQLSDCSGIELLANLTSLNLSYNLLTQLPLTHPSALITTLSMSYNRLEQLPSSLEHLPYIELLELAANCLMHHDALAPVSSLHKLLHLDLRLNPLSAHPLHRSQASSWLNPSLSTTNPMLDTFPLSRTEMAMIGTSRLLITPPVTPLSSDMPPDTPMLSPTSPSCPHFDLEDDLPRSASCAGSRDGSLVSGYTVTTVGGSRRKRTKRRKKKPREAVISDEMDYTETDTTGNETSLLEEDAKKPLAVVMDTAARLAELRATYGEEDWMRAEAGDKLNSLLGIEGVTVVKDTESVIQVMMGEEERMEDIIDNKEIEETTDDVTTEVEKIEGEVRVETRVSTVSDVSNDSVGIYSATQEGSGRETSPMDDKGTRVAVTRNIPGDDSGVMEHLELAINKEFIREVGHGAVTRVKWFLHSLEQCEMVSRTVGKVTVHLLFNTVRRDRRERLYTMSEAGYSTLMSLCSPVLEAAASASASLPGLQCVKCQSVFSQQTDSRSGSKGAKCPNCGSTMVIESESGSGDGEEVVALGIPACEALDLAVISDTRSSTPLQTDMVESDSAPEKCYMMPPISPVKNVNKHSTNLCVTADIHNHVITSHEDNLPDLLPRPQPESRMRNMSGGTPGDRSRNSSGDTLRSDSKEKSTSPGLSGSSSDISVLSNPSECSIEVIPVISIQAEHQSTMVESGSSTITGGQNATDISCDTLREDEEEEVTYHSCISHEDSGLYDDEEEESDIGTTTLINLSQTLSVDSTPSKVMTDNPLPPGNVAHVMYWDYNDFSLADHRVQLYCSLYLFREEEDLLLLARGRIHMRSSPSSLWPGVLVVTNKRLYVLRITREETEEPTDWIELRGSASVLKLTRLVGLVGGQGVGLEVEDSGSVPSSAFYRIPSVVQGDVGATSDCFYLVFGDKERTNRFTDQLVDKLQETVRSTPIPVTWLTADEESLLSAQVSRVMEGVDLKVSLFQLTRRYSGDGEWGIVSLVVTPDVLVFAKDFFQWIFQSKQKELDVVTADKIENITGMAIYESWPERLTIEFGESTEELQMETEMAVQQLVAVIRGTWERTSGVKLEEVTRFHLADNRQVIVMQSLLSDEVGSLTCSTFDLDQWIKVTSSNSVIQE